MVDGRGTTAPTPTASAVTTTLPVASVSTPARVRAQARRESAGDVGLAHQPRHSVHTARAQPEGRSYAVAQQPSTRGAHDDRGGRGGRGNGRCTGGRRPGSIPHRRREALLSRRRRSVLGGRRLSGRRRLSQEPVPPRHGSSDSASPDSRSPTVPAASWSARRRAFRSAWPAARPSIPNSRSGSGR